MDNAILLLTSAIVLFLNVLCFFAAIASILFSLGKNNIKPGNSTETARWPKYFHPDGTPKRYDEVE